MSLTRRSLLQAAAAGTALLAGRSGAVQSDGEDRVFVHPSGDAAVQAADAVVAAGGTVLLEYDNFSFVAAQVPASIREQLADDDRVALVEDDPITELGDGTQLLDDGDGDDGTLSGSSQTDDGIDDLEDDGNDDLEDDVQDGLDGVGGILYGDEDDPEVSCSDDAPQRASWGWDRIDAGRPDERGRGVDVAVLDTGIESTHCDLDVAGGRNCTDDGGPRDYEDRHGHGTHCAGIACALDDDRGVVGVAPAADCYAVKVLGDDGRGYHSWMAAGVDWCISEGVEVASMSFGSPSSSAAMDQVLEEAAAEGHLLVASAGNEGNDGADDCASSTVTYPATHPDVIAVSAMDGDDTLAEYSSVGEAVELLAPGTNVTSTDVGNDYATRSGTSMACPHVAGVTALVWERRGADGPGPNDAVRAALRDGAESVLDGCAEGHGLVNAAAATGSAPSSGERDGDGSDDGSKGGSEDGAGRGSTASGDGPVATGVEWARTLLTAVRDLLASLADRVP